MITSTTYKQNRSECNQIMKFSITTKTVKQIILTNSREWHSELLHKRFHAF